MTRMEEIHWAAVGPSFGSLAVGVWALVCRFFLQFFAGLGELVCLQSSPFLAKKRLLGKQQLG